MSVARKTVFLKFTALFLAVAMVFTIFAASVVNAATPTTTIRVTGVAAGDTVRLYPLAVDKEDANGNHYWYYNPNGQVKSRVEDGSYSAVDLGYFYTNINSTMDSTNHDGLGNATAGTVIVMTDLGGGVHQAQNVIPGLYLVTADGGSTGTSYNATIIPVNYKYSSTGVATIDDSDGVDNTGYIEVAVKKSSDPVLEKVVVEGNASSNHSDVKIGDTVTFKINLTIPSYGDAWRTDKLHYDISDSLSAGLTLDTSSIKIEGTAVSTLLSNENKHCASTMYTANDSGFTIKLYGEDCYQYSNQAGQAANTIAITYNAVVNSDAKCNFDKETNTANLEYSNQANSDDTAELDPETTYHYTFGIDTTVNGNGSTVTTEITKFGVRTTSETNNNVALEGAQFKLYDANKTLMHFTAAGQYDPTDDAGDDTDYVDHVTSGAQGQLVITGLDAGTYYLKESVAPTGYTLNTTEYRVDINPTYKANGELSNYTVTITDPTNNSSTLVFTHQMLDNGTITNTVSDPNASTFEILNTPMFKLAETGGVGVIVITACAAGLMVVCGSVFIYCKRSKKGAN